MNNDRCWLRLQNGWTVSVSERDTPPAICSVAAWPTRQDNLWLAKGAQAFYEIEWFNFGREGLTDQRCWVLNDVRNALKKVSEAPPPGAVS